MSEAFAYRPHECREWRHDQTIAMMSYAARGMLLALQDWQWEAGSLPADPEDCRAILRATEREWADFGRFLDHFFPLCEDGVRRNEQVTTALTEVATRVERSRMAGKASAEARASNRSNERSNGSSNRSSNDRSNSTTAQTSVRTDVENDVATAVQTDVATIIKDKRYITPSLTGAGARGPANPDHRTRLSEQLWPLWEKFLRHRTERGQAVGIQEADMLLTDLETWPEEDVRSAIEFAIKSGHKKLIKPSERRYDTGSGAAKPAGESPPGRKATLSIHEVTEIALASAGGEA